MKAKINNVLSIILALIISFLISKFAVHNIFEKLNDGERLAIGVVTMFVLFIIFMFTFRYLLKKL